VRRDTGVEERSCIAWGTDDGLVRRDAPTGVDRLLVSGARWFAVSRSSLVWIENGRVWASPLPS
jgi:hypothetical protein